MQTKKIKLNATEDVKEFVQGASKCDFDVDVYTTASSSTPSPFSAC